MKHLTSFEFDANRRKIRPGAKRSFSFLLLLCVLFAGCSTLEPLPEETLPAQTVETEKVNKKPADSQTDSNAKNCYGAPIYIHENEYQTIEDASPDQLMGRRLTWENINSFPLKSADMSTDELRQLCLDFFKFSKTALWIPDEDFSYVRNKKGTIDKMFAGEIYGGLPYIGSSTGNIYRLMDYMDEERGVVDMSEVSKYPKLFGNQCSVGSYWGWARVINSADYDWTFNMVASRGFIPVGPYTYNPDIASFNELSTVTICQNNGEQTMFKSYANMLPADGLISNDPSVGHVVMCSAKPVVFYNTNGAIDGEKSYLYIVDQHQAWVEKENSAGVVYQHKNYIDRKLTFASLLKSNYVPFTFGEFLGTDPVEETECTFGHEGSEITVEQLKTAVATANYGISDTYVYVKDAEGTVLFYKVKRAPKAGMKTMDLSEVVYAATFSPYADGKHTVEIVCQLGTGERPTIYTGTLVK
ncbi:MAG: hypothetical protein E7580_00255 [Ruminococcaceae bacterium]|nr:hypothetical protein [Oscillospiraceae bacterium]